MLDHVSFQCADIGASKAFYDAVLEPLGGVRVMDFGEAVGYGVPPNPDFWIGQLSTGEGFRESHIAFTAEDRAAVRARAGERIGGRNRRADRSRRVRESAAAARGWRRSDV